MIPAHQNHKFSRIYLWGFMGSGKSTIGQELAQRLSYEFVDLDCSIEKIENLKVAEIFSQKGEEFFRKIEHETLKTVARRTDKVIVSAGGGAPWRFDNAKIMNETGVTIYLEVSPKSLKRRLKTEDRDARPLLMNLTWKEIIDLYQNRLEFYKTAQITVSNDQNITKCLQAIMEQLDQLQFVPNKLL
ncbi:MAG: AAA family ATPase [Saprospiraceae bacterium]|nr:AAA family ATPase [Saprospiraceae bacterium]